VDTTWLRRIRTGRGITPQVLGEALGVSPQQVSKYELGASEVSDETAARWAEVLGVPEVEVRRRLGLWLQEDAEVHVSTLAAIELDPNLDEEARSHFRNQYQLLADLTRMRRAQEKYTDQEAVDAVERSRPGLIDRVRSETSDTEHNNPDPLSIRQTGDIEGSASQPA
jgi:transcriptional regulator with XRE-family HTH domain